MFANALYKASNGILTNDSINNKKMIKYFKQRSLNFWLRVNVIIWILYIFVKTINIYNGNY